MAFINAYNQLPLFFSVTFTMKSSQGLSVVLEGKETQTRRITARHKINDVTFFISYRIFLFNVICRQSGFF